MTENYYTENLLSEISQKKVFLENHLKKIEKSIYEGETIYLESSKNIGNVVKGWEHIFSAKPKLSTVVGPKKLMFNINVNERIFSSSSFNNTNMREDQLNSSISSHNLNVSNTSGSSCNPVKIRHKKITSSLSLKKRKLNSEELNGRALMNSSTLNQISEEREEK